jgi:hypothetical protein
MVKTLAVVVTCAVLVPTTAFALAPPLLVSCPRATEIVDTVKQAVPLAESLPEDKLEDCENLCAKKWLSACKAAAGAARKCQSTMIGKHIALVLANCKTEPDDEVEQDCKDDAKALKPLLKTNLASDFEAAIECCEIDVDVCVSMCQTLGGTLTICDMP